MDAGGSLRRGALPDDSCGPGAARLWESDLVVGFAISANGVALEANQTFQRAAQVEAIFPRVFLIRGTRFFRLDTRGVLSCLSFFGHKWTFIAGKAGFPN